MRIQKAELRTLELFRGAPDIALDRQLDDSIVPQLTASRYFAAIDELGSRPWLVLRSGRQRVGRACGQTSGRNGNRLIQERHLRDTASCSAGNL
jgi:hypothetical protein